MDQSGKIGADRMGKVLPFRKKDDKKPQIASRLFSEPSANDHADIARRILALSETVKEAIGHLIAKLDLYETDQAAVMLGVIYEGMDSVSKGAAALDAAQAREEPKQADLGSDAVSGFAGDPADGRGAGFAGDPAGDMKSISAIGCLDGSALGYAGGLSFGSDGGAEDGIGGGIDGGIDGEQSEYDELRSRLAAMIEAYNERRFTELLPQSEAFRAAYGKYDESLSRRYRPIAIN